MTPGEVRGLQHIAKAAGGSLSVNPSTGLPEAGFLENLLPMIIGGGLMAMTGGAAAPALAGLSPGMIGLGVGGVQALRTGNLMDGVKAGLGAYGGAGLAGGLMGMGATSPGIMDAANASADPIGSLAQAKQATAPLTGFDALQSGAQQAMSDPTSALRNMGGISGLAKTGLAAAAPMLMEEPEAPPPIASDKDMGQRYSYSAGPTTPFPEPDVPRAGSPGQNQSYGKERRYFTPGYTKIGAEDARKLYGFAEGGETTFKYDPGKQQYEAIKQGQSRSPTTKELVNSSVVDVYGDGAGSGLGPSGSSSDHGIGAIGMGQALSSYGNALGGLAPGGMLAGLIGAGMLAHGIGQLGQAETAAHSMGGDFAGHAGLDAGSFGYGSDAGWGAGDQGGWGGDAGGYGGDAGGDGGGGGGDGGGGGGGGDGGGGAGEANGGLMHAYAAGGYNLGDYSDGGRLLRGPGDGVSDSIPATIGKKQPARLADGEFVVPARIVSELGNGSTEAGARKLYAMMNRVQSARGKTVGKGKVAKNSRAERYLPA